ncbi:SDR family NAD(P)-dependent oxidoreductase [Phenylobacterium sp.]|uniref:SDR family NAD(P)-dependent oxidoreductase n=1 Tax=Phenylobacterium sp. TaxID=1871053 RepID=UPI002FC93B4E
MTQTELKPRPPSAESLGEAPGRGRLAGRRILVVGGGQRVFDAATDPIGNGRAMCLLYAREGAKVAVADANLASAEQTVALIREAGGQAEAVEADVTVEADMVRMFEEASAALRGGLDGLVYNVGTFGGTGLRGFDLEEWDRIFAINLRGAMLCCREGLERLEAGSPIVLISSIAALRAGSQLVAYDTSKAALAALMRHSALAGGKRGIRVNTVYPGLVDTPNGRTAGAGRPSRGKGEHLAFGRQATAWEIAYATLFFMSDESVYVTSQQLAVDSGASGL